jgi:hypothetical protein
MPARSSEFDVGDGIKAKPEDVTKVPDDAAVLEVVKPLPEAAIKAFGMMPTPDPAPEANSWIRNK